MLFDDLCIWLQCRRSRWSNGGFIRSFKYILCLAKSGMLIRHSVLFLSIFHGQSNLLF